RLRALCHDIHTATRLPAAHPWQADLLLRRPSRSPPLPAQSQVGGRISLSVSDRCSPRFTARSGTQRARRQGISSVGHLLGYPRMLGGRQGSAQGAEQGEPLRSREVRGWALPARARRWPICTPYLRGRGGGFGAAPPSQSRRFYRETAASPAISLGTGRICT